MKRLMRAMLGAAALLAAGSASAEVVEQRDDGFTLRFEAPLTGELDHAWATVGRIGEWWEDSHTYSGDASNLTLDLSPGGCWCETLPGETPGAVKHGEAVLIWPGRTARFFAALGPLQATAPSAVLTMTWPEGEDGARKIVWTYVVEGRGMGQLATVVDGVIGTQFRNYAALANAPANG